MKTIIRDDDVPKWHAEGLPKKEMLKTLDEMANIWELLVNFLGNVIEILTTMDSFSEIGEEFEKFLTENNLSLTIIFEEPQKTRFILSLIKTEEPRIEVVSYVDPLFPEYGCIYLPGNVNLVA